MASQNAITFFAAGAFGFLRRATNAFAIPSVGSVVVARPCLSVAFYFITMIKMQLLVIQTLIQARNYLCSKQQVCYKLKV